MAKFGVQSLINGRGNAVANQFIIKTENGTFFQSYHSVVAKITKDGKLILSKHWDYSNTTMRNLYAFLRDYGFYEYTSSKEMRKAIDNGEVTLCETDSLAI